MSRSGVEGVVVRNLHNATEVHNGHTVGDVAHYPQVVADEQECQTVATLDLRQKVHDLRAHRDVERRDRFVGDNKPRPGGESTGDANPLALAAREGARVTVGHGGVETHRSEKLAYLIGARGPGSPQRVSECARTVLRGLRLR
jgi:hypothetical protein